MKKLTSKTWFDYVDGHAVIYAIRKDTGQKVAAFTCHASCIPVIQQTGRLDADEVVLRVIKQPKARL